MGTEWPLVGRTGEFSHLREFLTDADHRGVVLAGAAGVGKTRLAHECLQWAGEAGLATARVTATQAASALPFGAMAPLLPAGDHGEHGFVDNPTDLLRRSAAALLERAGGRRLVLLVDDAHLLDQASATLVHQLADTGAAFLLATLRSGEPAPDPVMALWKDGLLERIELVGLRAEAIEKLLGAVLGPVDRATATDLAVRCQGNVLFLRELVVGALAEGTLRGEDGIWRLVGQLSPSDRLVELVEHRLGALEREERDLLELVAFAESLGPAELTALADPALAEALERKALLVSRTDGRRLAVRLTHPLYGEVLRARIPALRCRDIARSLAEVVEATGARRREDTLRVATWRLDGGGARPELMLAAATTARWRYDFPLAERLARAAVEAGAGFDAALLAAQLAFLQGRGAEAESELARLAKEAADDAHRGVVELFRLENHAFLLGRVEEGLRIANEAEAMIEDPIWRDEIAATRAGVLIGTQGMHAALKVVEPLLDRATGRGLVWACIVGSYCLGRVGRLKDALEASSRGHAAHLALSTPFDWYPWVHEWYRCEALAHAGRLEEAERLATDRYQQGLADGSAECRAFFAFHLGKHVGTRGHVQSAARFLREAAAEFRQLGRPQWVEYCLGYLVLALALAHRPVEAREAWAARDALGLPQNLYMGVDPVITRGWMAVAADDLPRARRLFDEAAREGERSGDLAGEAAALHSLARLGYPKEVAARLALLADRSEGELVAARAGHVRALVDADGEALDAAVGAFGSLGADLLAAEAAADAAAVWRRAADRKRLVAAEHRATHLAGRCEGATTPALQSVEARGRLTRAERETALLAAAGRSNKEIAEALYLSVRTVESHLQHVYEKLGISRRMQLAAALEVADGGVAGGLPGRRSMGS